MRPWAVGVLGIWRGRAWVKGGTREGQFTSNLRPRWTIPVTARRVLSTVSRRGYKGEERGRKGK